MVYTNGGIYHGGIYHVISQFNITWYIPWQYHMVYTRFRSSPGPAAGRLLSNSACGPLISIPRALPVLCGPVLRIETGPGAGGLVLPIKTCLVLCYQLKCDRVGILVKT